MPAKIKISIKSDAVYLRKCISYSQPLILVAHNNGISKQTVSTGFRLGLICLKHFYVTEYTSVNGFFEEWDLSAV